MYLILSYFMRVIVTGSVGTGKTTVAKALAKKFKLKYMDVNKIIKENKLVEGYDKELDTKLVDVNKLVKVLIKIIKRNKNIVIDSHLSHYLPKKYVDWCVVVKCNLKILKKRLKKRGYSERKIRENLDSEIFNVCLNEAREKKHNIIVIDTTKDFKI